MNNSEFTNTVVKYLQTLANYMDTIRTICRDYYGHHLLGNDLLSNDAIYVESNQDETCYLNLLYHELHDNWNSLYKLETENVNQCGYSLHESQIDKEIVDCLFNIAIALDNYIDYIELFDVNGDDTDKDVVDLLTDMREFTEFNKQFMTELETFYMSMPN